MAKVPGITIDGMSSPSAKKDRLSALLAQPLTSVQSTASLLHTPRSMFDTGRQLTRRALTPPPAVLEHDCHEGPEWSCVEDVLMLQVIKDEQRINYNLLTANLAHTPNWRHVSIEVSALMMHYRSARQCAIRYQLVVLPREEGRLVAYDPVTKKPRRCPLSDHEIGVCACVSWFLHMFLLQHT
jgi:hypothetical protein